MECYNCGGPHSYRVCPEPRRRKSFYQNQPYQQTEELVGAVVKAVFQIFNQHQGQGGRGGYGHSYGHGGSVSSDGGDEWNRSQRGTVYWSESGGRTSGGGSGSRGRAGEAVRDYSHGGGGRAAEGYGGGRRASEATTAVRGRDSGGVLSAAEASYYTAAARGSAGVYTVRDRAAEATTAAGAVRGGVRVTPVKLPPVRPVRAPEATVRVRGSSGGARVRPDRAAEATTTAAVRGSGSGGGVRVTPVKLPVRATEAAGRGSSSRPRVKPVKVKAAEATAAVRDFKNDGQMSRGGGRSQGDMSGNTTEGPGGQRTKTRPIIITSSVSANVNVEPVPAVTRRRSRRIEDSLLAKRSKN